MGYKNIYLYHLDYEIQEMFGLGKNYSRRQIDEVFEMVTKMAVLLCEDSVIFPASNYFESDFTFEMLNNISGKGLSGAECFKLISSSYNLDELLEKKKIQHGENLWRKGYHYLDFLLPERTVYLPGTLVKRAGSASLDIKSAMISDSGRTELAKTIYSTFPDVYGAGKLEQTIGDIPDKLGESAYLSRYITPLLTPPKGNESKLDNLINRFITREYIRSFLDEYHATCFVELPLLHNAQLILPSEPEYEYISYMENVRKLQNIKYKEMTGYQFLKKCTLEELFEFKSSDEWRRTKEPTTFTKMYHIKEEAHMKLQDKVTFGIITALPKELAAVQKMFSNLIEEYDMRHDMGTRYLIGTLNSVDKKKHYVAVALCGVGNNSASIRCTGMLSYFPNIKYIIMCGIAGGIPYPDKPDEHIRLGDIVVASDVIQYDYGKQTDAGFVMRTINMKTSAFLQNVINKIQTDELLGKADWHDKIDQYAKEEFIKPDLETDKLYDLNDQLIEHPEDSRRTNYPRVHFGTIASANIVLKSVEKRNEIRDQYHAKAAEMEGSGIADASWNGNVGYMIVRGICDYCDTHKNDIWQEYAAIVAAAYTIHIIENAPAHSLLLKE